MIPDYYYRKRGHIMAFVKKTWKNRIAEYINRRLLTNEDGSTNLVTVARDEGTISQEGDAFNAANMNDLEDRIAAEFDEINQSLTQQFTVVNFRTYNGEQWIDVPLPDGWKTGNTAITFMRVGNYITPMVNNKSMYECIVKDENTYMIIGRDTTAMNVDGHMVIAKI